MLKLDIGCGGKKREGHIGLDVFPLPDVDHVLDLEKDRFPFEDRSVDAIYSSHCFEHLTRPNNVWREISRVIKPGGKIEIWTPFAHSDEAFLPGHVFNWSPLNWRHVAIDERDFYSKNFLHNGYWKWLEVRYAVGLEIQEELREMKIPLQFAIRHMVNIVSEWGCIFEYVEKDPGRYEPQTTILHHRGLPAT